MTLCVQCTSFIIAARFINASDDGFSKSFVNVSPTDLKVNRRFISCAAVVEVVTGVAVVVVGLVRVAVTAEVAAVFELGAVVVIVFGVPVKIRIF